MRWTTYVSPTDGQQHPALLSDGLAARPAHRRTG